MQKFELHTVLQVKCSHLLIALCIRTQEYPQFLFFVG